MNRDHHDLVAFATKGTGSNEERRLRDLLCDLNFEFLPFDKTLKRHSFFRLMSELSRRRPRLIAMEGTGVAGGAACLLARFLYGSRYVVSSGDAVGPFIAAHHPLAGPAFSLYERLLCRFALGFIGWTPFLVGRALTFGCPRAMTAAGWSEQSITETDRQTERMNIRVQYGIPNDAIVFGLVGSIHWNQHRRYCYGLELVEAARQIRRDNVCVIIVGDGSGMQHLRERAQNAAVKVVFTGPVPANRVVSYLSAMDVGSLPQSTDAVGAFRYTTKISEYIAARLPVVTGQVPMAYDLDDGWLWRLPGRAPWSDQYVKALAELMNSVSIQQISDRRLHLAKAVGQFDRNKQVAHVTAFIHDLLNELGEPSSHVQPHRVDDKEN